MVRRAAFALLLAGACGVSLAHRAPNSFVRLDVAGNAVRAEMWVPQSELAFAMPGTQGTSAFSDYLLRHVSVETLQGTRWTIVIRAVRTTLYLDHEYLLAELEFTPPAGAPAREFVLVDDAVTHEVRNHLVLVTRSGAEARVLGALQYPTRRLTILPSALQEPG
jgi:hypothetical protein